DAGDRGRDGTRARDTRGSRECLHSSGPRRQDAGGRRARRAPCSMNFCRQFLALLRMSLSGATQRLGSVLTIVIGVACAVAVLVSMLAMGVGARNEELGSARDDRVVFTSTGAQGFESSIPRDEAATVSELPGIRKDAAGRPMVSF